MTLRKPGEESRGRSGNQVLNTLQAGSWGTLVGEELTLGRISEGRGLKWEEWEEWLFPTGRALTGVFLSVRKTEKPLFLPLQLSLPLVLFLITSCTINIDDQTFLPLSPALYHQPFFTPLTIYICLAGHTSLDKIQIWWETQSLESHV